MHYIKIKSTDYRRKYIKKTYILLHFIPGFRQRFMTVDTVFLFDVLLHTVGYSHSELTASTKYEMETFTHILNLNCIYCTSSLDLVNLIKFAIQNVNAAKTQRRPSLRHC